MIRKAEAQWQGDLRAGKGTMKLGSGAFEGAYSFGSRFESATGTNPEELIGAAHAGCFSMALSLGLTTAGHPPDSIRTEAEVHLGKVGEKLTITHIDLTTVGRVPGISAEEFERQAQDAKRNCIVSRALTVTVNLKASLES